MPAQRIHLVRHGEVNNPGGVLYGRLPNFHLSDNGKKMAELAAKELQKQGFPITAIYTSPLIRTQESAKPIEQLFGLDAKTNEDLIEPWNVFEGRKLSFSNVVARPHWWWRFRNPARPSWGEPFRDIISRMEEAINTAKNSVSSGDVVLVTHQLPIWVMHLHLAGEKLMHDPRKRRCALSSITSFEVSQGTLKEVSYLDPAASLNGKDGGAV